MFDIMYSIVKDKRIPVLLELTFFVGKTGPTQSGNVKWEIIHNHQKATGNCLAQRMEICVVVRRASLSRLR